MAADLDDLARRLDLLAADLGAGVLDETVDTAARDIAARAEPLVRAGVGGDGSLSNLTGSRAATVTVRATGSTAEVDLSPPGALVLASGGARRHVIPGRRLRTVDRRAARGARRATFWRVGPFKHPGTAGNNFLADVHELAAPAARDALDTVIPDALEAL